MWDDEFLQDQNQNSITNFHINSPFSNLYVNDNSCQYETIAYDDVSCNVIDYNSENYVKSMENCFYPCEGLKQRNYPETADKHPGNHSGSDISHNSDNPHANPPFFVKVVKKRNTANKKERKRTKSINNAYADLRECIPSVPADTKLSKKASRKEQKRTISINNAYADLRDCIPNVPADTKLSKIKTLRLATSYISFLKGVLDGNIASNGFFTEIGRLKTNGVGHKALKNAKESSNIMDHNYNQEKYLDSNYSISGKRYNKSKCRTGWPEHVWAHEFKQEQSF